VLSFEEFKRDPKVAYWAGTLAPSTRREYMYKLYQYFRWLWSAKHVSKTPEQFFQEHVENMFASKPTDLDAKRRHRLLLEEYVGLNGPLADAQNAYRRHVARVVKSFYLKNDCPLLGEVRIVLKPDKAVKKVHQVGLKEAAEFMRILPLDKRTPYLCVLYSGMRPNELFALRVRDVALNEDPATVNLVNKKGDRSDYIQQYHTYIGGLALQHLRRLTAMRNAKPSDPLLPFTLKNFQNRIAEHAQRHGFASNPRGHLDWRNPYHVYAMRKVFATVATEEAGIPERYVEYFLGHKGGVKEIYNRKEELYPEKFREHYLKLQRRLDEALKPFLEAEPEPNSS
jgi:integrase